jgi:hypothetical protein
VKHDMTGMNRGSLAVGPGAGRDLDTRNNQEHPRRSSSLRVAGFWAFLLRGKSLKSLQRKKFDLHAFVSSLLPRTSTPLFTPCTHLRYVHPYPTPLSHTLRVPPSLAPCTHPFASLDTASPQFGFFTSHPRTGPARLRLGRPALLVIKDQLSAHPHDSPAGSCGPAQHRTALATSPDL